MRLSSWRRSPELIARRPLNLALQGGGVLGAFTWGVLDRLLEEPSLRLRAISGVSAGAVNAVLLASGLAADGRTGARDRLRSFWHGISFKPGASGLFAFRPADQEALHAAGEVARDLLTRLLSPYQFNPFDYNPLRDILAELVDFERLRQAGAVDLVITATDVEAGLPRHFRAKEVTLEVVLASACLPHLYRAVTIGERHYWDGGYCANPALMPLVEDVRAAADTLLVQIIPQDGSPLPKSAPAIVERLSRLVFSEPLRRELDLVLRSQKLAREGLVLFGARHRRLRHHRLHHIDGSAISRGIAPGSHLQPGRALIDRLHDYGRDQAEAWLTAHGSAVGKRSSAAFA